MSALTYISMFSGIEAATVAWKPLGFNALAFAETDRFPSAVLNYHYPEVANLGDVSKADWSQFNGRADIIIGGSPCQSFSVAGLRKGLDDPRGNMALEYLRAVDRVRPAFFIWENVPGVLSVNGGRDFGTFLRAVGELGYGWTYRVLDAQYFGVAQRRRRVFVVGSPGDWRPAAAVLFEPSCMRWSAPPGRETREEIAKTLTSRIGTCSIYGAETLIPETAGCLQERDANGPDSSTKPGHLIPVASFNWQSCRSQPPAVISYHGVRRLTPLECERLQGFPDNYTRIPYRGAEAERCPDAPRYKALGNSMAVPVIRWLGERIKAFMEIKNENNRH